MPGVSIYQPVIYRGGSYQESWEVVDENNNPIDITGWTANYTIVTSQNQGSVIVSMTTGNGKITNGGANGKFTANLSPSETGAIQSSTGWHDFLVTDTTGFEYALTEGPVTFDGRPR